MQRQIVVPLQCMWSDDSQYYVLFYVEADSCAGTVAVRVRPFAQREIADPRNRRVVSMEGCETIVRATGTCSLNLYCLGYKQANFLIVCFL